MMRPARIELASPTVAPSRSPLSYARTIHPARRRASSSGGPLPHPSCQRSFRLPGHNAGAARELTRSREKIWYPTRDSNPEHPASEAGASAVVSPAGRKRTGATWTAKKKPGGLAAHPGFRWRLARATSAVTPGSRDGPNPRRARNLARAATRSSAAVVESSVSSALRSSDS